MKWSKKNGLSLIELLVLLAVVAILVTIAVPSFLSYLQMNRINVLAQNLYYNLQYARTEAIKQNKKIYVNFASGTSWCYGINPDTVCNCSFANNCTLGTSSATSTQVTLSSSGLINNAIIFEPNHGGSNTQATITYTVTGGTSAVSVQVDLSGTVQTCSNNVSGYQSCT